MTTYAIPELADGVFALGSRDWRRRIFDALAPTPEGTTYNCYLVKGTDKTALIDTIHPGFEGDLSGKIDQILGSHAIDYVIMNHAEPDHAGSIMHILSQCDARLLTTRKGAELARLYYDVPEERIQIVGNDDSIDLGGRTLSFIPAPFIHWPETMMTWLAEDGILFSCDFFGAHNTTGHFDDTAEDVIPWARKYYAEILMPLAKPARQAMDKIKDLDIKIIAPSHGPVYKTPKTIIDAYSEWTSGETKAKAVLVYVSMYRHTEKMVMAVAEQLMARGIEVRVFDLVGTEPGEMAGHLIDTRALVVASPTVLGALHPLVQYAGIMLKTLRPPLSYGMFVNSYGWGKSATKQGIELMDSLKLENVGVIEVNGRATGDDIANLSEAANILADRMLADDA